LSLPDSVNVPTDRAPLTFSALQLAWMHELGIEKPWIPGNTKAPRPVALAVPVADATLAAAIPSLGATLQIDPAVAVATSAALPRSAQSTPVSQVRPVAQTAPPAAPAASAASAATPSVTAHQSVDTFQRAQAASNLDMLSAAIASCEACGLCKEREQVVVGQGVLRPAIMVIGEGPGDQEDRQGVPFVGRSGMLLDNMLSAIGSSRTQDAYVANIIKCRPPGNRNPRPEEIAACRPYLMRQIELVQPFSILALGRFAAHTLLGGDVPLAEMRQGSYTLTHAGHNIPVVVSYHPAYLLRRPADKAAAWQDLQQIKSIAREYV
jgi:DNA polymerase